MTTNVTVIGSNGRDLEEALQANGVRAASAPLTALAGLAQASSQLPDAIVLDLRDEPQVPPALALVRRQHPALGVVIVSAKLDPGLMLEAMRAGVNEWVTHPVTAADLAGAISRVVARRAAAQVGEVFAFIGAKGDVGTTTVAVNVATALAKKRQGQSTPADKPSTVLVDLHLAFGDAAVYLAAEPRFSFLDAVENVHRLDEAYLRGVVASTKAGVDLLASPDRAIVSPVDSRRIRSLIDFAATVYRYVVLDVPRFDANILDALEAATTIVVVTNQELTTVKNASRIATTLRQRYGKDKVDVVVSRYDQTAEIGHDDVERVTGNSVKHLLPSDYRLAITALNKGRPVVLDNHNKLAGSIEGLARDLAGLVQKNSQPEGRQTGLFGKLTSRR